MMKLLSVQTLALLLILPFGKVLSQDYEPIPATKVLEADTFHQDYIIKDPYRWMEADPHDMLEDWVDDQNKQAEKYLKKVARKTNSRFKIDYYSTYENEYEEKRGKYYFLHAFYHEAGVPALFYREEGSSKDDLKLLIDPNKAFNRKDIRIKGYWLSKDSKYLVYQYGVDGTDWAEAKIIRMDSERPFSETLTGLRLSNIAWKNDGFYYSTFDNSKVSGPVKNQKVYYHKAGTPQEDDKLVFERKNNPYVHFSYSTTSNERYFVLEEDDDKNNRFNYFYIDFKSGIKTLRPLLMNIKSNLDIIGSHKGKIIARTFHQNNNGSIVAIDPANPFNWESIISPFPDAISLQCISFKERLASIYQVGDHPAILVTDYNGKVLYKLDLPIATSVNGFSGNHDDEEVLVSFESYTIPTISYKLNINTFEKELQGATKITFGYEDIVYKEIECMSEDSVLIPVTLVYEKGIELDGKNPLLLKAYGGFGNIVSPSFDGGLVHFIKSGGIYAYAKIRGGGEKGAQWASMGAGKNIHHTFQDFINVAEYLINEGYTRPEKLAATGGSNGGLVVSVAVTQRPDLFQVVVPEAAPTDMLRFEKYSVGVLHREIYGTVTDSTSFTRLLSYSPYHQIEEDITYPSMLIVTGENDDRVPRSIPISLPLLCKTEKHKPTRLS
ncbi:MAG: prolyl oligopeptidase family serine peptidase [Bacteroidales bacterium]|nr:prolyl oligopeptidase family serine peptidase [Bacteroidales bacterium]